MDLPNIHHEYSPRLDFCPQTPHNMLFFTLPTLPYRGTSLIRNCFLLGTYSRPIPRFKRLDWKQFRERPMALAWAILQAKRIKSFQGVPFSHGRERQTSDDTLFESIRAREFGQPQLYLATHLTDSHRTPSLSIFEESAKATILCFRVFLKSICKKSIPTQIRQHILYISDSKRELTSINSASKLTNSHRTSSLSTFEESARVSTFEESARATITCSILPSSNSSIGRSSPNAAGITQPPPSITFMAPPPSATFLDPPYLTFEDPSFEGDSICPGRDLPLPPSPAASTWRVEG